MLIRVPQEIYSEIGFTMQYVYIFERREIKYSFPLSDKISFSIFVFIYLFIYLTIYHNFFLIDQSFSSLFQVSTPHHACFVSSVSLRTYTHRVSK